MTHEVFSYNMLIIIFFLSSASAIARSAQIVNSNQFSDPWRIYIKGAAFLEEKKTTFKRKKSLPATIFYLIPVFLSCCDHHQQNFNPRNEPNSWGPPGGIPTAQRVETRK